MWRNRPWHCRPNNSDYYGIYPCMVYCYDLFRELVFSGGNCESNGARNNLKRIMEFLLWIPCLIIRWPSRAVAPVRYSRTPRWITRVSICSTSHRFWLTPPSFGQVSELSVLQSSDPSKVDVQAVTTVRASRSNMNSSPTQSASYDQMGIHFYESAMVVYESHISWTTVSLYRPLTHKCSCWPW